MRKAIATALVLIFCSCQLKAQQTVVKVQSYSGETTECVLGQAGAIIFNGSQLALLDTSQNQVDVPYDLIRNITFDEKAQDPVGIDGTEESLLCVYPNPTTDNLCVEAAQGTTLQLVDLQGRTVLCEAVQAPRTTLSLKALPSGVYFLRCDGKTLKIVKQ